MDLEDRFFPAYGRDMKSGERQFFTAKSESGGGQPSRVRESVEGCLSVAELSLQPEGESSVHSACARVLGSSAS